MALRAKRKTISAASSANAPLLDIAGYPARLARVIDLGVQENRFDEGKVDHQVMFTYELVTEFMQDDDGNDLEDKPRWFSEKFKIIDLPEGKSYNEILTDQYRGKSKMVMRSKVFDPKGAHDFDLSMFAGGGCVVDIIQKPRNKKDTTLINTIGGVSSPMKGFKIPALQKEAQVFTLDDPDMEMFDTFPDWLKDEIKANLDYEGSVLEARIEGKEEPQQGPEPKPTPTNEPAPTNEPVEEDEGDDEEW